MPNSANVSPPPPHSRFMVRQTHSLAIPPNPVVRFTRSFLLERVPRRHQLLLCPPTPAGEMAVSWEWEVGGEMAGHRIRQIIRSMLLDGWIVNWKFKRERVQYGMWQIRRHSPHLKESPFNLEFFAESNFLHRPTGNDNLPFCFTLRQLFDPL